MDGLDVVDLRILQTLASDGRMAWQDLADKVGLSLTPTLRRVRRLESDNFILGYAATVNEEALGHRLNAVLFIELERQSKEACEKFEEQVIDQPALRFCGKLTGKPDYVANVIVDTMEEYQKVLNDIGAMPGVARLRSNLLLKMVRPYGPPRPSGKA